MTFDFSPGAANQLLINPRLSESEKIVFHELKNAFESKFGKTNYFLVPSSGSSKKQNESVKLIALDAVAVLNSAQRFNDYFSALSSDDWGLVLPTYHVAGLGTYARAYLAGAQVFAKFDLEQIHFLSLVPTLLFDYVNQNKKAPPNLKKVFLGAGALHAELKQKALDLGWPIVETYGMTETASMIAVQEGDQLSALPDVKVRTENELLQINCNSLLTCYIQKIDENILITEPVQNHWYQTEDRAIVNGDQINLLGRSSEYIKILGEGVSLAELKDQLAAISLRRKISPEKYSLLAVDNPRSGHEIILAVEKSVNSVIIEEWVAEFNQAVRPYEKIKRAIQLEKIPLSELGKIKTQELTEIVLKQMKAETL